LIFLCHLTSQIVPLFLSVIILLLPLTITSTTTTITTTTTTTTCYLPRTLNEILHSLEFDFHIQVVLLAQGDQELGKGLTAGLGYTVKNQGSPIADQQAALRYSIGSTKAIR
jgi:hypothetical protein